MGLFLFLVGVVVKIFQLHQDAPPVRGHWKTKRSPSASKDIGSSSCFFSSSDLIPNLLFKGKKKKKVGGTAGAMLWDGVSFLLLFLSPAFALPIATQLSEEDEKVTKCITEILVDTLSRPSPMPVTGDCMRILREDERVLAMLHHQHLLTELEELAHQENAKHRLGHKGSQEAWEGEDNEQEDAKKRDQKRTVQREATSERMREQNEGRKEEEEEELAGYEKTERTEQKVKEEKVSKGEGHHKALEEQVKELMEKEKEEEEEEEEEEARKKRRSSSETWSSKEYFGHIKKRGPGQPKIREGMLQGNHNDRERNELVKRRFKLEEEEEEDSSEEEPKKYYHRGLNKGRHHEDWEDEEEEEEVKKGPHLAKRVAEKASDEETAQFEQEEKGVKISNSQTHLHKGWKPWLEGEQEEEVGESRHGDHHKQAGLGLKKRHGKDGAYVKGRHHSHDVEEEKEREASPDEELKKLEEIKQELERAAEKLEELKRG